MIRGERHPNARHTVSLQETPSTSCPDVPDICSEQAAHHLAPTRTSTRTPRTGTATWVGRPGACKTQCSSSSSPFLCASREPRRETADLPSHQASVQSLAPPNRTPVSSQKLPSPNLRRRGLRWDRHPQPLHPGFRSGLLACVTQSRPKTAALGLVLYSFWRGHCVPFAGG